MGRIQRQQVSSAVLKVQSSNAHMLGVCITLGTKYHAVSGAPHAFWPATAGACIGSSR